MSKIIYRTKEFKIAVIQIRYYTLPFIASLHKNIKIASIYFHFLIISLFWCGWNFVCNNNRLLHINYQMNLKPFKTVWIKTLFIKLVCIQRDVEWTFSNNTCHLWKMMAFILPHLVFINHQLSNSFL